MFDFDVVTGPPGNLPAAKRPAAPGTAQPSSLPAPRGGVDTATKREEAGSAPSPAIAAPALEGSG